MILMDFFHVRIIKAFNETTEYSILKVPLSGKLWQMTCIINLCNILLSVDRIWILAQASSNYFAVFTPGQGATNPPVTTVGWHSYLGNIISPHFLCLE